MRAYSVFFCVAIMGAVACERTGRTIIVSIPDNFNGLLLISEDRVTGVEPQIVSNEYVLVVPPTGKLAIKNLDMFSGWHKELGRYKNGVYIPYETPSSDTEIALFGLPYVQGRGYYFFVGTRLDYDAVSKKYDYDKLPLATKIDPSMLNAL